MNLLITGAWKYTSTQRETLEALGYCIIDMPYENDILPCKYEEVEAVICNGLFLSHPIERFTALKLIQLTGAGADKLPMDYVKESGIEFYNADGVYSVPMAEFVMSSILCVYKQSKFFYRNAERQRWEKHRGLLELNGRRVCIVGCGNVGRECAKRLKAFGCYVVGLNRTVRHIDGFNDVLPLSKLDEAVSGADIVIVSIALTPETRYLIGSSTFESIKDGGLIVNVSRGAVVDTEAMKARLKKGGLTAVLDVFEEEPLPSDDELWKTENVYLTPHNSFVGDRNADRLWSLILKNFEKKKALK